MVVEEFADIEKAMIPIGEEERTSEFGQASPYALLTAIAREYGGACPRVQQAGRWRRDDTTTVNCDKCQLQKELAFRPHLAAIEE